MIDNMNNKIRSFSFIFITLFIAVLTYVLFRPPLSWFPNSWEWDKAIIDLSRLPNLISNFIKYHLADVLWALALAEAVCIIKKNLNFSVIVALIATILFEFMQYLGIVKGTGDIFDVIFVAVSLSIYFLIKKRSYTNEEKD
jgi:hypothetical protein